MKRCITLIATVMALGLSGEAFAATYVTDTATYTGLGDQNGTLFDQIILNSVVGTANGPGTYLINTVDFVVGNNSNFDHVENGTFTNTATVDGNVFTYSVPYTINISTTDSITIGGNSFIVNGFNVYFNTLTLTNGVGTVSGDLTATVSELAAVPEPATWGMMILGFGAMGFAMRRRAKVRTAVSFA